MNILVWWKGQNVYNTVAKRKPSSFEMKVHRHIKPAHTIQDKQYQTNYFLAALVEENTSHRDPAKWFAVLLLFKSHIIDRITIRTFTIQLLLATVWFGIHAGYILTNNAKLRVAYDIFLWRNIAQNRCSRNHN